MSRRRALVVVGCAGCIAALVATWALTRPSAAPASDEFVIHEDPCEWLGLYDEGEDACVVSMDIVGSDSHRQHRTILRVTAVTAAGERTVLLDEDVSWLWGGK